MNIEGRAQLGRLAIFPPGDAKADWSILRALSESVGKKLGFDTIEQLRRKLYQAFPRFQRLGAIEPAAWTSFGGQGEVGRDQFRPAIANYYMTDPISRASARGGPINCRPTGMRLASRPTGIVSAHQPNRLLMAVLRMAFMLAGA